MQQIFAHMDGDDSLSQHVLACVKEWTTGTTEGEEACAESKEARSIGNVASDAISPMCTAGSEPICPHQLVLLATMISPV